MAHIQQRIKVVQEGVAQPNGMTVEVGALMEKDERTPVCYGGHHDVVVGFAENFLRESDGWISHLITLNEEFSNPFIFSNEKLLEWYDFSIFARIKKREGDLITRAQLVGINMIPQLGIPKGLAKEK